jgi:hypothetical protein
LPIHEKNKKSNNGGQLKNVLQKKNLPRMPKKATIGTATPWKRQKEVVK